MDSKEIFDLRNEAKNLEGISKLNKLNEALTIAQRLFAVEPYDEWIQKAFAYTLIDLSKYYISNKNVTQAGVYYNRLLSINFQEEDTIIENQKSFLRPKIDVNYFEVQTAEQLSKIGNHQNALNIFKKLIAENRLAEIHHEAYGWIIYRYIKDQEAELTSIQVRTRLKDYMNLKNERPSMLHSMILNFGLHYSKNHPDFNLYSFFKLWTPSNLRKEDKEQQYFNGKEIPSLISRIFREFIDKDLAIDIDYLIENVSLKSWNSSVSSNLHVLDLLREPFFWRLFNVHKENRQPELWVLFNKYNQTFSKFEKSKWHSEVLNIAERFMKETEEWRFLDFFKNWNPENLLDEDWMEIKKDDNFYKPLAIKCIKKVFNITKTQGQELNENWLLPLYSKAVKLFPNDEWILRENALLLIKNKELEAAIEIYRRLILELGDKSYIWNEFSSCFANNRDLKIGMLAKAIQLEGDEDFLGDIHLELANALFDDGLIENCLVELNSYKRHRELKGWRLSEMFNEIADKLRNQTTTLKDNRSLYEKYIPMAEQYSYEEIEWTEAVLVDKWKNDEGKERIAFTDGKTTDFSIGGKRFNLIKQSSIGTVFKFKLHKQEIKKAVDAKFAWMAITTIKEYKFIPLIVEKTDKSDWSILDDVYAIIDYINIEKNVIHAVTAENKEVFFSSGKILYQAGDFIKAKLYTKKIKDEIRLELKDVTKIEKQNVIDKFQCNIAIVDGVNEEKELFHFVINQNLQGIIRFTETIIRPKEGEFIKLRIVVKFDKKQHRQRITVLSVETTHESSQSLRKDIVGLLKLKFKMQGVTYEYEDLDIEDANRLKPDFGFISDYYVPRQILKSYEINKNCQVKATLIFTGDKWKINTIKKLNDLVA